MSELAMRLDETIAIADIERDPRIPHGAAPSLPAAYNDAIHGIAVGPGVGSCAARSDPGEPSFADVTGLDPALPRLIKPFRKDALAASVDRVARQDRSSVS